MQPVGILALGIGDGGLAVAMAVHGGLDGLLQAQCARHQRTHVAVLHSHDDLPVTLFVGIHPFVELLVAGMLLQVGGPLSIVHIALVELADVLVAGLVGHGVVQRDDVAFVAALLQYGVPGDGGIVGHAIAVGGGVDGHDHHHAAGAVVVGHQVHPVFALVQGLLIVAIDLHRAGQIFHAGGQQVVKHAAVLCDLGHAVVDGVGLGHVHIPGDQVARADDVILGL